MKNWLGNILNRDSNSANTGNANLISKVLTGASSQKTNLALQCSSPIGQKKTPQPLEVIQQFSPFKNIANLDPSIISHKTFRFAADATLFLQGTQADAVYFLLSGTLELHPDSDDNLDLSISAPQQAKASYEVIAHTPLASLPLNTGKYFGATAKAKTLADVLVIYMDIGQLWQQHYQETSSCIELSDIKLPKELGHNQFFMDFAHAYHKNKLQLPSLPNVALKLRNAMQRDIGIRDAVEIVQIDPAIVTKLIQVSNSPLYASARAINNCHEAVTRLGLDVTRNLVMSINMKQMFQSKNKRIMKEMQNAWRQSIYVSSLAFVLAEEIGGINPDEALLAGLINDIGIIPLLHFAEMHLSEYADLQQIIDTIPLIRAPVGRMVLNNLGFPNEMAEIPYEAENWFYDSGDEIKLIDIVILAKLHSYIGTEQAKEHPFINTIPAYAKLKNGKLNPDLSLSILHKAQQRIHAAMSILA